MEIRRVIQILVLGVLLGLTGLSNAWANPSISMRVDRDQITVDDQLRLTITIQGGSALTTPDIPPKGNFEVVGQSQGNSIEILNGQMSVTNTFQYVLQPRKAGKFSIGPVKAHIEGKEYTAGPINITVLEGGQNLPYQPYGGPGFGKPGLPPGSPQITPPRPIPIPGGPSPGNEPIQPGGGRPDTFLTAQVDKSEAFVGEQILYTFRLYSAVSLQNAQLKLPEFKDFISEEIIKERQYEVDLEGRRYAVNEWRLALFPTKKGELSTGIAKVEATVPVRVEPSRNQDPFFRNFPLRRRLENRVFQAGNQRINVKPLPPAPPDFTGLVGEFKIESSLDQNQIKTGETAHLKVNIRGKGNIRDANLSKLGESSFFKVYPGNPKIDIDKTLQGISGKKEFDFALVAQRPGMATVGPLETSYFNPQTKSFEPLTVPEQRILIQGGGSEEPLVTAGINQPAGIFPETAPNTQWYGIKNNYDLLMTQIPSPMVRGFWWLLILGTPFSYLTVLFWQKRRERIEAMAEDRKRSKAFRKAKTALGGMSGAPAQKYSEELSQILREYLGDVFAVKGLALTPSEVEDLLKSREVPAEEVRRMVYMLEQLDAWKYGGWAEQLPEGKSLKQEILHLLREIEKVL
jgi:hypothetical protein